MNPGATSLRTSVLRGLLAAWYALATSVLTPLHLGVHDHSPPGALARDDGAHGADHDHDHGESDEPRPPHESHPATDHSLATVVARAAGLGSVEERGAALDVGAAPSSFVVDARLTTCFWSAATPQDVGPPSRCEFVPIRARAPPLA